MEQLKLSLPAQGARVAFTAWLDARLRLFAGMTWRERTEYVLREVEARYAAGAAPLEEVRHWQRRLEEYR